MATVGVDAILDRVWQGMKTVETSVTENNLRLSNQELIQFALTARGKNSNHRASQRSLVSKRTSQEKLRALLREVSWAQRLREVHVEEVWDLFKLNVQTHGVRNSEETVGREDSQVTPQTTTSGRVSAGDGEV